MEKPGCWGGCSGIRIRSLQEGASWPIVSPSASIGTNISVPCIQLGGGAWMTSSVLGWGEGKGPLELKDLMQQW